MIVRRICVQVELSMSPENELTQSSAAAQAPQLVPEVDVE
jgi:hypothetical protein